MHGVFGCVYSDQFLEFLTLSFIVFAQEATTAKPHSGVLPDGKRAKYGEQQLDNWRTLQRRKA